MTQKRRELTTANQYSGYLYGIIEMRFFFFFLHFSLLLSKYNLENKKFIYEALIRARNCL